MKKILSKHFPFSGYKAMTVWPFIFIRKGMAWAFNEVTERHENIHGKLQKEMLLIPFYLWYGAEWLFRLIQYRNKDDAYKNISFEREARANENDPQYLEQRSFYAWLKYLKQNNEKV